jgi:capsular polysaccharide biosynthesis protein
MELVSILRLLWRHRVLVAIAALVSVLVGLSMVYRIGLPPKLESRHYQVGIGSVTALVDTPHSQVVDLGGDTGSDIATLSARASLLASLMASSPLKDEIASRAGIRPDELLTAAQSGGTSDAAPAPTPANDAEATILKASIANLDSGQIPIISVNTQAPTEAAAARLANESIAVLQQQIKSQAGTDKVPEARRVVVRQLGPARSATVSRGPSPTIGIAVAVLVLLLGCATIVGMSALVGGWRRAVELEGLPEDAHDRYREPAADLVEEDEALIGPPRELSTVRRASATSTEPADVVGTWQRRGT